MIKEQIANNFLVIILITSFPSKNLSLVYRLFKKVQIPGIAKTESRSVKKYVEQ